MNRHPKDAGTLGYIIAHKREDGLPLLAKALPSMSDMNDFRQTWPDSDVALYLTEEKALSAWESLAPDVRDRVEVRAVIVYYAATVVTPERGISPEKRRRLIKNEVSRLIYQRNKLGAKLDSQERRLREVVGQIPLAETDNSPELLRVLREKETEYTADIARLRADYDEVAPLCEKAKEACLALRGMMKADASRDELHIARAAAREAMRHIKAVLDVQES